MNTPPGKGVTLHEHHINMFHSISCAYKSVECKNPLRAQLWSPTWQSRDMDQIILCGGGRGDFRFFFTPEAKKLQ